ncbi:MAG: allantoinase AllB [Deltaproteobacteria bacterium]|nr:allantoinase AllB [Deltaproteobacteria bacterium]
MDSLPDLVLRSRRCVLPTGVTPAAIVVREGRISSLRDYRDPGTGKVEIDAGDDVVMAGLVDTHVHLNDPGRSHWEGFDSGTRSAAAGGVTTVVDMPLNSSPVTTTLAALEAKAAAAAGKSWVDYGFWGGLVPGNEDSLNELLAAGALGIKCFLVPSGIDDFPAVTEEHLRRTLPTLAQYQVPLLVHAELPGPIEAATASLGEADRKRYATYLASRPESSELEAIDLLLSLARDSGAAIHLVHLATASALGRLAEARREGLPISIETCPHYLTFAAQEIVDGATEYKCAPPIRSSEHREGLWQGLKEGLVDSIGTDHSPCPPEMKNSADGDFFRAWGGIASLQLLLPAVWTEARRRGFGLEDLSRWLSIAPARLGGLEERKGTLAVGYDADLVVWKPDEIFRVDASKLYHRHRTTPYAGMQLQGVVESTFLRGERIFQRNNEFPLPPGGRWLQKTRLRREAGEGIKT